MSLSVSWGWEKGVPASKRWRSNLERLYGHKEGFMFTEVTLRNGEKSCDVRAMVDTGSAICLISEDLVEHLGFVESQKTPNGWLYGVGGSVTSYAVPLQIELPNGTPKNIHASMVSLGFDFVLGLDFMRQAGMVLHLAEGRISIPKAKSVRRKAA